MFIYLCMCLCVCIFVYMDVWLYMCVCVPVLVWVRLWNGGTCKCHSIYVEGQRITYKCPFFPFHYVGSRIKLNSSVLVLQTLPMSPSVVYVASLYPFFFHHPLASSILCSTFHADVYPSVFFSNEADHRDVVFASLLK